MANFLDFLVSEVATHMGALGLGMLILWLPRSYRRRKLKPRVEEGYLKLRKVCEPQTLNPDAPGNQDFMKSDARDVVNPLRGRLEKAGFYPPRQCSTDQKSLDEWFRFLGEVRDRLS